MFPDLRRESAQRTVELDFPGYAIGGLSVGEPRPMTHEMVDAAIRFLPEDKPRYLMGVGTPEEIVHYVAQGVDMMDCVLPTRAARHGLLFTSEGRITIKNARYASDDSPLDPNCGCKVCAVIPAPTSGICMHRTSCWRRSSTPFTTWRTTLTPCAGCGNRFARGRSRRGPEGPFCRPIRGASAHGRCNRRAHYRFTRYNPDLEQREIWGTRCKTAGNIKRLVGSYLDGPTCGPN
jgi:hypothetical protein